MRKKKLLAGAMLALWGMSCAVLPAYASDEPELQMIINDNLYVPSEEQVGPQLIIDRVYVPLRLVGESLNHQVQWLEQSRTVCIFTDDNAVLLPEDAYPAVEENAPITIYIDGELLLTDDFTGMPYIHESGRTMVPLRVVGENLNCDVQWLDYVVLVTEKQDAADSSGNREDAVADVADRNQGVESDRTADSDDDTDATPWYYSLTIQGESIATAEELEAYLYSKEDDVRDMMAKRYPNHEFIGYPEGIAGLYIEIGKKYNIRGDLAFAQAVKETGYFQFYGIVQHDQNNFCGLGATGVENTGEELQNGVDPNRASYIPGMHGSSFASVADGVEAHIQHLYAYATTDDLPEGCELIDPRFKYIKRGIAPLWTDLNGRWAVPGDGYGESIIGDYWLKAVELE